MLANRLETCKTPIKRGVSERRNKKIGPTKTKCLERGLLRMTMAFRDRHIGVAASLVGGQTCFRQVQGHASSIEAGTDFVSCACRREGVRCLWKCAGVPGCESAVQGQPATPLLSQLSTCLIVCLHTINGFRPLPLENRQEPGFGNGSKTVRQ